MADRNDRLAPNAPGAFYVDAQCIDCDLCRQTAPQNFDRDAEGGFSYVVKQPETDDERQLCIEAIDECPVECIGDDG